MALPIKNMNSPSHIFQGAIFEIIDRLIAKIKLEKAEFRRKYSGESIQELRVGVLGSWGFRVLGY